MKAFLDWLEGHPHEYMRINFLWTFAAILSPWRNPMLVLQLMISVLLLAMYEKGTKA